MKPPYRRIPPPSMAMLAALAAANGWAQPEGRGLPQEARAQIQTLFSNHSAIRRQVKLTPTGYTAITESDDPQVAAALKTHVKQMSARLAQGLAVRRWDPAFAEYADHYADLTHEFTETDKGVRMTVNGRTAAAVKVAQNHAGVVSAFASSGWPEHDRRHAPAAE